MKSSIALGLLMAVSGAVPVFAQETPLNVATTAVPFLRINPDARSGGMGELGIATRPDAQSALFNLAKTPFTEARSAVGLNYTPWLADIAPGMYMAEASGYHRFDTTQALSATIRYFSLGDVNVVDYSGNQLQTARPREYSLDLGYSRKLSDRLGVGIAFRYISSTLATGSVNGSNYQTGNAFSGDLSLYYDGHQEDGQGFTAGLALSNLGTKIGYTNDAGAKDYLPATLGLGLTYTVAPDENNRILFGVDAAKLLVPNIPSDSTGLSEYQGYSVPDSWGRSFTNSSAYRVSVGAEYTYLSAFSARMGYYYETQQEGGMRYFTAGLGLKYGIIGLNFSYIAPEGDGATRNPISNTVKFGVAFDL